MTEDSNSDGLPGQQQPDAGAVRTPEWARIGPSAVGHGPAEAVQRAAQAALEESKLRVPSHTEGLGINQATERAWEIHDQQENETIVRINEGGTVEMPNGPVTVEDVEMDTGSTEQAHLPRNGWFTTHEDEAGKRVARFDDGQVTEVRYGK